MANSLRPLQPALTSQESPPQLQSRLPLTQKPKRTVTLGACVACRKRKSKCDGNRPVCTCCVQKDTDCVYELAPNEKPSQAMKRKYEEIQSELSDLKVIMDLLRFTPEKESLDLLRRVREGSRDTSPTRHYHMVAEWARHGYFDIRETSYPTSSTSPNESEPLVTLPPLRVALNSATNMESHRLSFRGGAPAWLDEHTVQRKRLILESNISPRLGRQIPFSAPTSMEAILHRPTIDFKEATAADSGLASIKNWTTVTHDSAFLVDMLSTWEVLEYNYYHYLDREAFLEDMVNGRTDFCSALLVNALLASACFHSSNVKDRHKPFSENSMTTSFYREAKRLWDQEAGADSLTRVQAAICLFLVLGKYGRDKEGHEYLLEACRIGHDLHLFQQHAPDVGHRPPHILHEKWTQVRAVTAWALFNFQLSMSCTYSLPLIINTAPPFSVPYNDDTPVEALFRAECAKNVIILDYLKKDHRQGYEETKDPPDTEHVQARHSKLIDWWESRSPAIHPDNLPSKENLLCAMMYHVDIMNLCRPLLAIESPTEKTNPPYDRARSATSSSLKELRRLLHLHEIHHGWASAITYVLHPISVASFGSLEELSQDPSTYASQGTQGAYQGLMTCLWALRELSSYSYYAQPLFRFITQKCQTFHVPLPPEIQNKLEDYTSVEWTKNAVNLVSSQYMPDTRESAKGSKSPRMDAIISAWDRLSVWDMGKGKGKQV